MSQSNVFPFLTESLYAVIAERDFQNPNPKARPIVFERHVDGEDSTLAGAEMYQKRLGGTYGQTWIARLLPLNPAVFTIIAVVEETGQVVIEHVHADTVEEAACTLAQERPELSFVAAVPGALHEGIELHFFGECVVDADTLLETYDESA